MRKYILSCFKCAVFSFVFGPPIAAVFFTLVMLARLWFRSIDFFQDLRDFPLLVLISYTLGGAPAILATAIYVAVCMKVRSRPVRSFVSVVVGLVVWAGVVSLLFTGVDFQNFDPGNIDWSLLVLVYLLPVPSSLILSDAFERLDFFDRSGQIGSQDAGPVHRPDQ